METNLLIDKADELSFFSKGEAELNISIQKLKLNI